MRQAVIAILIAMVVGVGVSVAGEKEELLLQKQVLVERIGRLQAEYAVSVISLKEVEAKIAGMAAKEQEGDKDEKGGDAVTRPPIPKRDRKPAHPPAPGKGGESAAP